MRQRDSSHTTNGSKTEQPSPSQPTGDLAKRGEKLTAAMDDLLDEIDEALEKNAEEFVASYVQRGGE